MRKNNYRLFAILGIIMTLVFVSVSGIAMADVGNMNRYVETGSSSGSGDDGLIGFIVGLLVSLLFDNPTIGLPTLLIIIVVAVIVWRKAKKKGINLGSNTNTPPAAGFMGDPAAAGVRQGGGG